MHKTGACLQKLKLWEDPRWQALGLAPGLPLGNSLLGNEHALSVSEVAL
jgi:hypothetical protein